MPVRCLYWGVFQALNSAIRFLWRATAGYRLRPWRSPYLRWRLETFTGRPAEEIQFKHFLRFAFEERRQLVHFLQWIGTFQKIASGQKS